MGGRGASSGTSHKGKKYGTEYKTLYRSGNIKFIQSAGGNAGVPMETMAKNRVYVSVNKDGKPKSIGFYDKNKRRFKQVDILGTPHKIDGKNELPHVHKGYIHDENGDRKPTLNERKLIERVNTIWYNQKNR